MIPVFLFDRKGRHGYNIRDFDAHVLQICEDHQNARRACAFALILHDAESPQFSKVLNDRDYWDSLDSISGSALTVFSVFSGFLSRDNSESLIDRRNHVHMHRDHQRIIVRKYFNLDELTFPALLFFQVSDSAVSGMCLVTLKAKDVESAYTELSELLRIAAKAVRDSTGRLISDPDRAFTKIKTAVKVRTTIAVGKELGKSAIAIKDWLNLIFEKN